MRDRRSLCAFQLVRWWKTSFASGFLHCKRSPVVPAPYPVHFATASRRLGKSPTSRTVPGAPSRRLPEGLEKPYVKNGPRSSIFLSVFAWSFTSATTSPQRTSRPQRSSLAPWPIIRRHHRRRHPAQREAAHPLATSTSGTPTFPSSAAKDSSILSKDVHHQVWE